MRLDLIQHGDAVAEPLDSEPPLRAAGRREVEADDPSNPGALLPGGRVRRTEGRRCGISHRQGCAPRPMLPLRAESEDAGYEVIRAARRAIGEATLGKLVEVQHEGEAS